MRFWPQDEHRIMSQIGLLKHVVVVLIKSEGRRRGWHPAVQMCTELLVQSMSVSLSRNFTGSLKGLCEMGITSTTNGKFWHEICLCT
jgi:hypothetical protein